MQFWKLIYILKFLILINTYKQRAFNTSVCIWNVTEFWEKMNFWTNINNFIRHNIDTIDVMRFTFGHNKICLELFFILVKNMCKQVKIKLTMFKLKVIIFSSRIIIQYQYYITNILKNNVSHDCVSIN